MRRRHSSIIVVIIVSVILFFVNILLFGRLKIQRQSNVNSDSTKFRKRILLTSLPPTEIRPIIILSTFRTGSSLTGDILQKAGDSFYLYEPLNPLNYLLSQNVTRLQLVNGSVRSIGSYDFNPVSVDILTSLITCNFSSLDIETVTHGFLFYSTKSIPYITCVNVNRRETPLLSAVRKCLPIWKESCENSTFRIMKIVRLSMDWMKQLLDKFPKLLVVHLVRDPRPIQVSRDKLGADIFKDLRKSFRDLCDLLSWNLFFEISLNNTYSRVVRLYYENLALHPFRTSKWLYNALGLHYTPEVQEHVYYLTSAGHPDDCPTCAIRANSSAHVYSWKGVFNRSQLNDIQEECGQYMRQLGYPTQ